MKTLRIRATRESPTWVAKIAGHQLAVGELIKMLFSLDSVTSQCSHAGRP